jgi:hypothetical protein
MKLARESGGEMGRERERVEEREREREREEERGRERERLGWTCMKKEIFCFNRLGAQNE